MTNKTPSRKKKAGDSIRNRSFKHGSRALSELLKKNQVDGRTSIGLMLKETRDRLSNDAGGWEQLTERERILIEQTAALHLIISSILNYAFTTKDALIDGQGRLLPALTNNYLAFSNTLRLNLLALGLHPAKPTADDDLDIYLKQKRAKDSHEEAPA